MNKSKLINSGVQKKKHLGHGFAAGCEAVALPRRYVAQNHLGCAPGSGSALISALPVIPHVYAEGKPGGKAVLLL